MKNEFSNRKVFNVARILSFIVMSILELVILKLFSNNFVEYSNKNEYMNMIFTFVLVMLSIIYYVNFLRTISSKDLFKKTKELLD